jgi:hypothetical protein
MINAYITGEGVKRVILSPQVNAIGDGINDEHALRRSFLEQQSFYSDKKTPGDVIGVINGNSGKVTLFDNGSAIAFFWQTKKRLTVRWCRANC